MNTDPHDVIGDALTSTLGRIVAALSVPLGAIVASLLLWLQNVAGIDLQVDPEVATAFVASIILGFALTAAQWLRGKSKFETTALEVDAAYRAGHSELERAVGKQPSVPADEPPVVPPGMGR